MATFRLDRFLTLYLFRLFMSKKQVPGNKNIPILMYHSISDDPEQSHPYYHINTSSAIFDAHMHYLRDNNYSVINLNELENYFTANNPTKYVVITFDDGFRDFYTSAYPILKKYGFSATVFLPTGFIQANRASFKGKECMTWDEVQHASRDGIIFGSHTVTHPQLKNLSEKEIEHEIKSSKERIEDNIGITIDSFSYPYAFPEDKEFGINLRNLLIKYGYANGVSTKIGTANKSQDEYFYSRLPANSDDDDLFFEAKLHGAYNWLSKPQSIIKFLKKVK